MSLNACKKRNNVLVIVSVILCTIYVSISEVLSVILKSVYDSMHMVKPLSVSDSFLYMIYVFQTSLCIVFLS